MTAYQAGTAYVEILPAISGMNRAIRSQLNGQLAGVGEQAGKKVGTQLGEGIEAGTVPAMNRVQRATGRALNGFTRFSPALSRSLRGFSRLSPAVAGVRQRLAKVPAVLGRMRDGFNDANAAASAFSGRAGTLGGKLRTAAAGADAFANRARLMGSRVAAATAGVRANINRTSDAWAASIRRMAPKAFAGGLIAVGAAAVTMGAKFDQAERTLKGLYGSSKDAHYMLGKIRKLSEHSPINYEAYSKAAQTLAYMGYKGPKAAEVLKNVSQAVVAAGNGADGMERASQGMLKMINMGKVTAQTLNQISDAGVPVFDGLAAHFHKSVDQVREMVKKGKVSIDDVMEVIQKAQGKTFKQMKAAYGEANKSLANRSLAAAHKIENAFGDVGKGLTTSIGDAVEWVAGKLAAFIKSVPRLWHQMKAGMDASGVTDAFRHIGDAIQSVWSVGKKFLSGFVTGLKYGFGAIITVAGKLAQALSTIARWFGAHDGVVRAFGVALGVLSSAFITLRAATMAAAAAQSVWKVAMAGFSVKSAIAGIASLVGKVKLIPTAVGVASLRIVSGFKRVGTAIKAIPGIIAGIGPALKSVAGKISGVVSAAGGLKGVIAQLGKAGLVGGVLALAAGLAYAGTQMGHLKGAAEKNADKIIKNAKSYTEASRQLKDNYVVAQKAATYATNVASHAAGRNAHVHRSWAQSHQDDLEKTSAKQKKFTSSVDYMTERLGVNKNMAVAAADRYGIDLSKGFDKSSAGGRKNIKAFNKLQTAMANSTPAQIFKNGLASAADKTLSLKDRVNGLSSALNALIGKNISAQEATDRLGESFDEMRDSAKTNGRALAGNSKAARANRAATRNAASSVTDHVTALLKQGKGLGSIKKAVYHDTDALRDNMYKIYGNKKAVDKQLAALGLSKKGINKLISRLKELTKQEELHKRAVELDKDAQARRYKYQASHQLGDPHGLTNEAARYSGGPTAATGGLIRGPGTGTSDSIAARVSDGEFVVRASQTKKHLGLLRQVNTPGFANGGLVGFAGGGVVKKKKKDETSATRSKSSSGDTDTVSTPDADDLNASTAAAKALTVALQALKAATVAYAQAVTAQMVPALVQLQARVNTVAAATSRLSASVSGAWVGMSARIKASVAAVIAAQNRLLARINAVWAAVTSRVTHSDAVMRASVNSTWSAITAKIDASDSRITTRQSQLQSYLQRSWTAIAHSVQSSVSHQNTAFTSLNSGMAKVRTAMSRTASWAVKQYGRIRSAAASPVKYVLDGPFNGGIIKAWNKLNSDFNFKKKVAPVTYSFASGGKVNGPGTGTSDSVHAMLSNGEFVVNAKMTKQSLPFLRALNAGNAEAMQATGGPRAHLAKGGMVADTGGQLNAKILKGLAWLKKQKGKPYVWGGVGPGGYDCSGLTGSLANVLRGEHNPYHRIGTTGNEPWPGFKRGLKSAYGVGWNSHHTSGTLSGTNMEARDFGIPVLVGPKAVGAQSGQFSGHAYLPTAGGKFVSGGGDGIDPKAIADAAFKHTADLIAGVSKKFPGNKMAEQSAGVAKQAMQGTKSYAMKQLDKLVVSTSGASAGSPEVVNAVRAVAKKFGWGSGANWAAIKWIIDHENRGWDPTAKNPNSSAAGLFQKMTSLHGPLESTVTGQAEWGLNYMKKYGGPIGAKKHWMAHGSYDSGGSLPPGLTMAYNGTNKPEAILTNEQWRAMTDNQGGTQPYIGSLHVTLPQGASVRDLADETMFQVRHASKGVHG